MFSKRSSKKLANGEWHFYCLTWNGKTGEVRFYFEGHYFGNSTDNETSHWTSPGSGNMFVGLKLVDPALPLPRYIAKISYLNAWSVDLPEKAVKAMSAGGLNINGNLMAWRDVPNCFMANISVTSETVVFFPGKIIGGPKLLHDNINSNI